MEADSKNIKSYIKQVVEKSIKKGLNTHELQILAPMYKGENGIDNLNLLMQELFNPKSEDKNLYRVLIETIYPISPL